MEDWTDGGLVDADSSFMLRAIRISRKGYPAPNPHVGCVLVKGGKIVSEGYHDHAGGPHAEAVALAAAGADACGATAYVTMEPCNHLGRTPPCSKALISAGVGRVVIATRDPNPIAHGGIDALRGAGIAVSMGCLTDQAGSANRQFLGAMAMQRPIFAVKAATSLDGRIALPDGRSQWITGLAARRAGHRLRAELGAVLVGRRTVETDNPELTARVPGVVNQPLRIVLDPFEKLTGAERIFNGVSETLRITRADFPGEGSSLDLDALAKFLFSRKVTGVLIEGGAATISAFLSANLIDRLELFMAPKLLGSGPTWVQGFEAANLEEARFGHIERVRRIGSDLWLSLERG